MLVTGEDVLERREPVRVEDHERVGARRVESAAHVGEAGRERRVAATAELDALVLRQHDRRLVTEHGCGDDLTHRRSRSRSRSSGPKPPRLTATFFTSQ